MGVKGGKVVDVAGMALKAGSGRRQGETGGESN